MGTSMTLSQRDKSKLSLRNHAMLRSKIPPEMEKYYRYKADLVKNKPDQRYSRQVQSTNQDNWRVQLPNDIPSIEQHSQIKNPALGQDHISEEQNGHSEVQQWDNNQLRNKLENQKNIKTSNAFLSGSKNKNSRFHPLSTHPQEERIQQGGVSHLPNNSESSKISPQENRQSSKNTSSNRISSNRISSNPMSSNKKSSNRPESESNHALSEIILQREGQASTHLDKFIVDEIKEDSRYRQTTDAYQNYGLRFVEQGPNEEDDEQIVKNELRPTKQSSFLKEKAKSMQQKKVNDTTGIKESIEGTKKLSPQNMSLQLNSNINQGCGCENSLKPILTNMSDRSRTTNTNLYSNNNSLSSNTRPKKLIYF